ncbi:peptidoglycan/LPS O-acetylase OafA/YrhL [Serratia marcescens]|uniref:Peptidoglycan/LPS O-acetylase OafA/YrhL n=2 Tax=Serratia marcescens TaxID=615 RepID=A0AA46K6B5_SERMA|nr:peptidoglycan/LPS O-acetylase OafA/YrhL [Serratia marcescens]CAI2398612.1 O-acetyltransferase OatA [Serratia marcescens]
MYADGAAMNSNVSYQPNHMRWLEALRGIACLSVVIEHYLDPRALYFSFGNFGVIVFFIISGYIVTATTIKKKDETVTSFLMLRIGRLYPAYIVSVLLSFLVYSATWYELLGNFTMLQRFFGVRDINGVYWTLQIEWVFYFVIAACLAFSGVTGNKLKAAFLSFVFISLVFGVIRYYMNIKAPSAVPIGISVILISSIFVTEKDSKQRCLYGSIFVIFTIIASSFLSYSKDWGYHENPYRFISSDLIAIAMFLLFKNFSLRSSLLEFFGKISFSLYLFHQPCAVLVKRYITEEHVYAVILSFAFSTILSLFIFKMLEEPVNKKVKVLVKRHILGKASVNYT